MKIERLYAITVYLLNHGRTSAAELARQFEVSVRTIQRDIDSLGLAGIPVAAFSGRDGGYEIAKRFRMDSRLADAGDYSRILTALGGLVSATDDREARRTLEKIAGMAGPGTGMILDFSVLREGEQQLLETLRAAVRDKRTASFIYTGNDGKTQECTVEPVAVLYRWYSWYLLAYHPGKGAYRTYKLVRMREIRTGAPFEREHGPAEKVLRRADQADSRRYTEVLVKCGREAAVRAGEYLKGEGIERYPDGAVLMQLRVVENEQLWLGLLLSLGDQVEVVSPERIRRRVGETAEKIAALYR